MLSAGLSRMWFLILQPFRVPLKYPFRREAAPDHPPADPNPLVPGSCSPLDLSLTPLPAGGHKPLLSLPCQPPVPDTEGGTYNVLKSVGWGISDPDFFLPTQETLTWARTTLKGSKFKGLVSLGSDNEAVAGTVASRGRRVGDV